MADHRKISRTHDQSSLPDNLDRIACGMETVELMLWARQVRGHYHRQAIRSGLALLRSWWTSARLRRAVRPASGRIEPDALASD